MAVEDRSNFQLKYLPVHIIGLYGVVLHVLLLNAFAKDPLKCFRNSATYLVANLSVCDLTISLCEPYFDWFKYLSLDIIMSIVFSASVMTVISIAVDRYLMVVYPFKHKYLLNGKKIVIFIIFIWILASLNGFQEHLFAPTDFYIFSISTYVGVALILTTGLLYVLTSVSLQRQTRNLALHNTSASNRSQAKRLLKEKQFVMTIILITCVTVIGIVPYWMVEHVLKMHDESSLSLDMLLCFLTALFMFTFATNPLIYFLRFPRYRKSFYILYYWKRLSNWDSRHPLYLLRGISSPSAIKHM
jgi:hypothetical protein